MFSCQDFNVKRGRNFQCKPYFGLPSPALRQFFPGGIGWWFTGFTDVLSSLNPKAHCSMEDKEPAAEKPKRARSGCTSFQEVLFRALLAPGGVQEPCGIFSTDSHSPRGGRASPGLPGEADQKSTPHSSRKTQCPRALTTLPTCPPPLWLGPGGCHLKEGDNMLSN